MYCAACELEIKGDDKETCPICGSPLSEVSQDVAALASQDSQDQTAIGEIIEDINSLIGKDEQAFGSPDSGQEDVFVLKDYDSDSLTPGEGEGASGDTMEPGLVDDADVHQKSEVQPLPVDVSQDSDASLDEMLASIRQSMEQSEDSDDSSTADAESPRQDGDGDFISLENTGLADTDEMSADSSVESYAETVSVIASDAAQMPETRRSPFLVIGVIILLIAGGYYVFTLFSGDRSAEEQRARTVMTLADLQKNKQSAKQDEVTHGTSVKPDSDKPAPAGDTQNQAGAVADVGASQADSSDSQQSLPAEPQTVGKKPAETPVAAEAQLNTDSEIKSAEVGKPATDSSAAVKPARPSKTVEHETGVASGEKPAKNRKAAQPVPVSPPASIELPKNPLFTVHVGSYRTRDAAASEAARIKAKGYDPFLERVDLGQRGIWYRVKIGKFTSRDQAERLRKKIHRVLVQDSRVVTHQPE